MPAPNSLPELKAATHFIVGIGASAGGLEAINQVFANMPDNTGYSFIVVQHISPDHKSLMAELMAKYTLLKVREAEDEMPLLPNNIYLIPSGKLMKVKHNQLRVWDKEKTRAPNNAIDIFFESLAEDAGSRAVGIVLSGTGSDGTKGIEHIKRNSGVVVVQDPSTAAFDGMPNNAITTGLADLIIPAELIAEELINLLNEPVEMRDIWIAAQKDEYLLREILMHIRRETGLDFKHYKRPTIIRRLAKRMNEVGIRNIEKYLELLKVNSGETEIISKEFLINVSSFLRDKEAFDIIGKRVVPEIMNSKQPDEAIRIWSLACSTGEEAYSLAIVFSEYFERNQLRDINIKIFATDIDRDALETASRGIYSASIQNDVPKNLLEKYFVPEGNSYRIHPAIRKMVLFSYHDILKDPPYSRMNLVACRNMLIYINPQQQQDIQRKMQFALTVGGFLFLGPSESLSGNRVNLAEFDRKWKIFRCHSRGKLESLDSIYVSLEKRVAPFSAPAARPVEKPVMEIFNSTLLEARTLAGLLITSEFEIKEAVGHYKNFIDFPENGFRFNLLKMVLPDLAIAVNVAVNKSLRENTVVSNKAVKIRDKDVLRSIHITAKPVSIRQGSSDIFIMVILEEEPHVKGDTAATPLNLSDSQQILDLQQELNDTRNNMQQLLEEVETSNEELRSANEEMTSGNEELQSTNEELQSLNEELHTVSAEHQFKIKELIELNDDLNNYFSNSDIGQIFIDGELIIRKFSPSATRIINLIESDLGRSITNITTKIKNADLLNDIHRAMDGGEVIEKEIQLNDGSFYLMRITTYQKQDNTSNGVVINFINISEVKKLNSVVQAVFDLSKSAIDVKKPLLGETGEITGFTYTACNLESEIQMGLPQDKIIGKTINEVNSFQSANFELYKEVVLKGTPASYEFYDAAADKWYEVLIARILGGIVTTSTDITEKKKAAAIIEKNYIDAKIISGKLAAANTQLEQSNFDLLQFASIASHDLKEPLRKIEAFGNLLNDKLQGRFEETELVYLQKMIRASNRMKTLIEDVLTFSKLSNTQLPKEQIDLDKTICRIKDDLEITIREKRAEIKVEKLPVISAVPGQMHQLFQNLISNAMKFSGENHPVIVIAQKAVPSDIAAELRIDPSKFICVSVKDNGIGFDEVYKDKIFGIFQRLHGQQYEGTGIGLAICRKIAENHLGYLVAKSKPGQGAEFFVLSPK